MTNICYLYFTDCLCPCSRVRVSSYLQNNMSSVVKKMVDIRNQLLLEKSSLTSTRRQRISMADPRGSAFAVGSMLGIGIITAVVLIIVISDLPLLRCQRCLKSKVKPWNLSLCAVTTPYLCGLRKTLKLCFHKICWLVIKLKCNFI